MNMDDRMDALKSPVYQKIMKKNKQRKNRKRLKEIGLFVIINIIVPIIVSVGVTLITMLLAGL